ALLTHLDINHEPLECHRFMTAPCFVLVLLAVLEAPRVVARSLEVACFSASLGLQVLGTLAWATAWCPALCPARLHFGKQDFYAIDCREATNARIGEGARAAYVAQPVVGLYTGCRASFVPGGDVTHWGALKTGGPASGRAALAELDRTMP